MSTTEGIARWIASRLPTARTFSGLPRAPTLSAPNALGPEDLGALGGDLARRHRRRRAEAGRRLDRHQRDGGAGERAGVSDRSGVGEDPGAAPRVEAADREDADPRCRWARGSVPPRPRRGLGRRLRCRRAHGRRCSLETRLVLEARASEYTRQCEASGPHERDHRCRFRRRRRREPRRVHPLGGARAVRRRRAEAGARRRPALPRRPGAPVHQGVSPRALRDGRLLRGAICSPRAGSPAAPTRSISARTSGSRRASSSPVSAPR